MEIHTPTQPKRLRITQTMIDDWIIDPVMGAQILFNVKLDAFQRSRLKYYWWFTDVIDSSGFGTGKSFTFWLFLNLRCIILGDQHCVAYYQTFGAGKRIFWEYYTQFNARRAPLFHAQLGKVDLQGDISGKDNTKEPACCLQHFRNESLIAMPAPNWFQSATGQAGLTFNVAGIDEWTKVETMTKEDNRQVNEAGHAVGGINQQILGRVRRASYNQYHPIWGNHRVFLATAESTMHPAHQRVKVFKKEIAAGNPHYALISYSFKDVSNLKSHTGKPFNRQIVDWPTIKNLKANLTKTHFLREGLGIWQRETKGWYSEAALERGVQNGLAAGTEPETAMSQVTYALHWLKGIPDNVHYFLGIDPAPAQGRKSDDGALAALRVKPRPGLGRMPTSAESDWLAEYVWAFRVRNADVDQWSGFIHAKHKQFNFTGMLMDPGGGGQWIMPKLQKAEQLINGIKVKCRPIGTLEENSPDGAPLMCLFKRGDPGVEAMWPLLRGDDNLVDSMHVEYQAVLENGRALFPLPFNERPRGSCDEWPDEKQWALKNLDAGREQMVNIQVATRDTGEYLLTRNGAKQFAALGKKDIAYAMIYAYIRFLMWLKLNALELDTESEEGDSGVYFMK